MTRLLAVLLILTVVSYESASAPPHDRWQPEQWTPVEITRVIDGDTVRGDVIFPFGNIVLRDVSIRAANLDTWEVSKARIKSEPFKSFTAKEWEMEFQRGNKCLKEFKELLNGAQFYIGPIPEREHIDPWRDVQARWLIVKDGIPYRAEELAKQKGWVRE